MVVFITSLITAHIYTMKEPSPPRVTARHIADHSRQYRYTVAAGSKQCIKNNVWDSGLKPRHIDGESSCAWWSPQNVIITAALIVLIHQLSVWPAGRPSSATSTCPIYSHPAGPHTLFDHRRLGTDNYTYIGVQFVTSDSIQHTRLNTDPIYYRADST